VTTWQATTATPHSRTSQQPVLVQAPKPGTVTLIAMEADGLVSMLPEVPRDYIDPELLRVIDDGQATTRAYYEGQPTAGFNYPESKRQHNQE
jgi:hypothetical protein